MYLLFKVDHGIFHPVLVAVLFFWERSVNPFTAGTPFLGTKLLGIGTGRGLGALKGLNIGEHHSISVEA